MVVCFPLSDQSEISPVLTAYSGTIALIKVDLPTPECPDIRVVLSFSRSFN
ncbi:hypothetical protein D3C71_1888820 [compost metagenome]